MELAPLTGDEETGALSPNVRQSGEELSPEPGHAGTLTSDFSAFTTVGYNRLLFKPPDLWPSCYSSLN